MANTTETRIKKSGLGAAASRRISNAIIYVLLVAITIVWLFPFVGILLESFKTETKMQTPYLFPKEFGFDPRFYSCNQPLKTEKTMVYCKESALSRQNTIVPRQEYTKIRNFSSAQIAKDVSPVW